MFSSKNQANYTNLCNKQKTIFFLNQAILTDKKTPLCKKTAKFYYIQR